MCFYNRIDRTTFFAKAAKYAFGQINVVALSAATAVFANVGFNGDGHCGANSLAELAGDAALFPVFIPAQSMQAPKTWACARSICRATG